MGILLVFWLTQTRRWINNAEKKKPFCSSFGDHLNCETNECILHSLKGKKVQLFARQRDSRVAARAAELVFVWANQARHGRRCFSEPVCHPKLKKKT
jgi:hypothetical protein